MSKAHRFSDQRTLTNERHEAAWSVALVDGGPFPVFSAVRLSTALPGPDELNAMTTDAVSQLLAAMDTADTVGWTTANITAGLLLAATEVRSWEGGEWALESGPDDEALAWAQPETVELRSNGCALAG